METLNFHDGNIYNLLHSRHLDFRHDVNHDLQMHSSLIRRLAQEKELEGHQGCVNTIAWNSKGSLLISGSDDTHINLWSYPSCKLLHSIDTGHSTNIFCTKFIPETSDELVVSGAGDGEVRLFHLSRLNGRRPEDNYIAPSAQFQCHTSRVKKLAVEAGNPNVVWSASEDGTLRQHDLREGDSCPPVGSSHQECRNVLFRMECQRDDMKLSPSSLVTMHQIITDKFMHTEGCSLVSGVLFSLIIQHTLYSHYCIHYSIKYI